MGQKYKTYMPPEEIEKDEFETLLVRLAQDGREDDAIFIDKAYKEDTNSAPTLYRLQWPAEITGIKTQKWCFKVL